MNENNICLIPVLLWLYLVERNYGWTALVLLLSSLTDVVDGAVMFGWGLLSVAQMKMLHPLLESAILGIPAAVSAFMGTILVAVCAADTALSVRSSMPAHSSRVK